MNKIIIGVIAVIVLGGLWWAQAERSDKVSPAAMEERDTPTEGDDAMKTAGEDTQAASDAMMKKAGSYEAYDSSKLSLAENGKVVLFFRASWCPTCRALDNDIKKNMNDIPEGVTILDVNYDTEKALKEKYGITTQHTLVQVDKSGNEIAKWVGSNSLEELVSNVK